MRGVRFHSFGGPEVLVYEDGLPRPKPGRGEVLIKVAGAGVNYTDLTRRAVINPGLDLPATLGVEVSGTVEEVGPGEAAFAVGDRVMAQRAGVAGQAEYAVADASLTFPCPPDIDLVLAGAIPNTFLTAYHLVKTRAQIRPGETVLVQAGASGIGTAAIQLARVWGGARVIATASTEEKLELARSLGAQDTINYATHDFEAEVRALTSGAGVDVVLECVGGEVLEKSLRCLAPFGRLVVYGNISGSPSSLQAGEVFMKNRSVLGLGMGSGQGVLDHHAAMAEMVPLFQSGRIRVAVARVLPMSEVSQAHAILEARKIGGKVILTP